MVTGIRGVIRPKERMWLWGGSRSRLGRGGGHRDRRGDRTKGEDVALGSDLVQAGERTWPRGESRSGLGRGRGPGKDWGEEMLIITEWYVHTAVR